LAPRLTAPSPWTRSSARRPGTYRLEFVEIWNKATAARISTYLIFGGPGSRCCILNGAAARTCHAGDGVIIAASKPNNS
jgi:aspartate 1-decarboxylase